MSISGTTKINQLVSKWPTGIVYTQQYLTSLGYSSQLVHRYIQSGWLEPIGTGAYRKKNDAISWSGGLAATQSQLRRRIHAGGKTALAFQGMSHYGKVSETVVYLFASRGVVLPRWFSNYPWGVRVDLTSTMFIPDIDSQSNNRIAQGEYSLYVSCAERAILEVLYHIPRKQGFDEAYKLMEMLPSMRPVVLQQLLSSSRSVKVNRLFCFMAERINHPWFRKLDMNEINMGSGKREIIKEGKLSSKYNITIPEEYTR